MGLESFLSCGGETRAGGPSVRASCSCLASLVVCVPVRPGFSGHVLAVQDQDRNTQDESSPASTKGQRASL